MLAFYVIPALAQVNMMGIILDECTKWLLCFCECTKPRSFGSFVVHKQRTKPLVVNKQTLGKMSKCDVNLLYYINITQQHIGYSLGRMH